MPRVYEGPLRARSGPSRIIGLAEISTYFVAPYCARRRATRWAGWRRTPPCLYAPSATTIHDLGIRDYSSGRKSHSSPSTFGPFAFGLRSRACGAILRSLIWRYTASFAPAIWSNFASTKYAQVKRSGTERQSFKKRRADRCNSRLRSRRGPLSKFGYGCSGQLALDISSRADFMHALTYPPGNTPG